MLIRPPDLRRLHLLSGLIFLSTITGCTTTKTTKPTPPGRERILPAGVSLPGVVSEDEAVWIALLNNSAFREAMTGVGFVEADLIQAKTLPNPTLSMLLPAGPKQLEFAIKYPVEALWLRPRKIEIAKLDAEGIGKTLQQNGLDLVRDVRVAYINLTNAKQRVSLAKEAVALNEEVCRLVKSRRKAGTALELEETTAQGDKLQAELELSRLTDDIEISTIRLQKLLGVWDQGMRVPPGNSPPPVPGNIEALLNDAYAARPDLRAAEIAIESAVRRAGLAQVDAYKLTAVLDTNGSGSSFEAGPGLELPVPLSDRGQAGILRANAMIEKTSRHYLAVHDQITQEVKESFALARQAQRSAGRWAAEVIPPLERAVEQANNAFRGGAVPFLQVVESNRKLTAAKLRHAEERANSRRAIAELERATGHGLPSK
ncbi:MAG: TolC family protein [Akkermansiaceae bacterium]